MKTHLIIRRFQLAVLLLLCVLVFPLRAADPTPPATIRVGITDFAATNTPGGPILRIEEVPLEDYVADVIVNEWYPGGAFGDYPECLKAGAVAIKMYAWHRKVYHYAPYSFNGQQFDVRDDTHSQVYKKNSRSTNAAYVNALNAVKNTGMVRNDDGLFLSQYWNGEVIVSGSPFVRSGPGTTFGTVTTAAAGTSLYVCDGGLNQANGYRWWFLKPSGYPPTYTGYVAGTFLHYPTNGTSIDVSHNGNFIGQLTQWGSKYRAYLGEGYQTILRKFYDGGPQTSGQNIRFFTYSTAVLSLPVVSTLAATSVTSTSAVIRGRVDSDGGSAISDRRFDWGTSNPMNNAVYSGDITVAGTAYSASLTGLSPGTTYNFRAWSRNGSSQSANGLPAGWATGEILSFTTPAESQNVTVANIAALPGSVQAGQTTTLSCRVTSQVAQNVILGASIYPAGQTTVRHDDPARDAAKSLVAGANDISRNFDIPAGAVVGAYDVEIGIWKDNNSNGAIDAADSLLGLAKSSNAFSVSSPPAQKPAIRVTGNGNLISNGATTTSINNNTDHGSHYLAETNTLFNYRIYNDGSGSLGLTGSPPVEIQGSASFSLNTAPATPVAAGAYSSFKIAFNPASAGLHSATVTIRSNDPAVSAYTFAISGRGLVRPGVLGTSTSSVSVGTSASGGSFSVLNSGASAFGFSAVSDASWLTITNSTGNVGAGLSTTLNFTYSANFAVESRTATITLTASGADGSPKFVIVTQNGVAPTRIVGLSGNLAFGSVNVGSNAQATLTITNNGNSPLSVTGISVPTGFSGSFSGTVAAGASQNVAITFAPTAATNYGGNITVNSNATGGTGTIAISGTGTSLPPQNVAMPFISPNGAIFTSTQMVAISTTTSGAEIRYTLDGSTPGAASPLYTAPLTLTATTTVKAVAMKAGMTTSAVASAVFTKQPAGEFIGHWPLDAATVSPSIVADSSPAGRNGAIVGTLSGAPGVHGEGLRFGGNGGHVSFGTVPFVPEVTAAVWVNLDAAHNLAVHRWLIQGWTITENFGLRVGPGVDKPGAARFAASFHDYPSPGVAAVAYNEVHAESDAPATAGGWHHVAMTYKRPTLTLYVDGVVAGTATTDINSTYNLGTVPGDTGIFLGADNGAGESLRADMDEVRIYTRALTSAEIAALATPLALGSITFTSSQFSAAEGMPAASLTLTRSGSLASAASVTVATQTGSANDGDYSGGGTANFAVGASSAQVSIAITDDSEVESPETFSVMLSNPVGAMLGATTTATVMIQDNDDPVSADSDSDALDDEWERQYFGSIAAQDGNGNPDGDGYRNYEEFERGMNPTQFTSPVDQPDLAIGVNRREMIGANIFDWFATGSKIYTTGRVRRGKILFVDLKNSGTRRDSVTVVAGAGDSNFNVRYYLVIGSSVSDVTRKITGDGLVIRNLAPGAKRVLKVSIVPRRATPAGESFSTFVDAHSKNDENAVDSVYFSHQLE